MRTKQYAIQIKNHPNQLIHFSSSSNHPLNLINVDQNKRINIGMIRLFDLFLFVLEAKHRSHSIPSINQSIPTEINQSSFNRSINRNQLKYQQESIKTPAKSLTSIRPKSVQSHQRVHRSVSTSIMSFLHLSPRNEESPVSNDLLIQSNPSINRKPKRKRKTESIHQISTHPQANYGIAIS